MKSKGKTALLIACVFLVAFAYLFGLMWLGSHTYRDNEANFRRIFGFPRPANVTVHRSEFWEGRHLFFLLAESCWHIELDAPDKFTTDLIEWFNHEHYTSAMARSDFPAWFAPKPPDAYERYDSSDGNNSLLIDKQTGRVFLCHYAF